MTEKTQDATIQFGITRKSLEAVKIFACPHCGAPGLYKNDEHNRQHWPGIIHVEKVGQPVGGICPNCNNRRVRDRNLGELTASIPRWIWNCVLGFKWCVATSITLKRRLTGEI
jgi:hypothetical protein